MTQCKTATNCRSLKSPSKKHIQQAIITAQNLHILVPFARFVKLKVLNFRFFIAHRIYVFTFLPFKDENTDIQLVIDTLVVAA